MEGNGLAGGMYSGLGSSSGMLGLELPLQQPQNQHQQQPAQTMVHYGYPAPSYRPKQPSSSLSEDEETDPASDGIGRGNSNTKGGGGVSPWQRMKWTDSMVRLLIMAVYYIGDEAGSDPVEPTGKRKGGGGGGGGGAVLSQKKGKWKSVSRAMMEKGFYVSPQQCEDKFNDLNKRYKRVNDILGKGTACQVVENQSLLDSMNLAPKLKDEVKKLLNSKHLFFREMCAYHNSCGHGPNAEVGSADPPPVQHQRAEPAQAVVMQQQRCSHSTENGLGAKRGRHQEVEEDDEDDESEKDDEYDAEDEDDVEGNSRGGEIVEHSGRLDIPSSSMQQLDGELASVMQDEGKSSWEKKQWMDVRLMQLEEQQVGYQLQSYELEKQRLKWAKFTGKKEREMERAKLENERRRLENERMMLLLRKKELEMLEMQHQLSAASRRAGDPSSITN